jgi:hypothetical protein
MKQSTVILIGVVAVAYYFYTKKKPATVQAPPFQFRVLGPTQADIKAWELAHPGLPMPLQGWR